MISGKYKIVKNLITSCNYNDILWEIGKNISKRKQLLISPLASYTLTLAYFNKDLEKVLDRFNFLLADSQWIRFSLNFLYRIRLKETITGKQLMLRVCSLAQKKNYKIALYGTTDDTLKKLIKKLNHSFPKLKIVYNEASKFRSLTSKEKKHLVSAIHKRGTDIMFVALGSPLQEFFSANLIFDNPKFTKPIVIIPVGAAFDFTSEVKPQAPKWLQKVGFEWLFRFINEPVRLWKRYLIYGPLFLFLVIMQKLFNRVRKVRMKKFLIIVFCFIFIFEAFFRILFLHTVVLDKIFINSDSWWRLRWIRNKRYDSNDVANYFSIYQYDEKLGWNLRPNIDSLNIGSGAILTTNSEGIRGNKEYPLIKNSNIKRIIVLGDSFTFGEEISNNLTYPAILEQLLPDIEVLNMGVGGYGNDQMLIKLINEGIKYKPDIVILGFLGMDMERNLISFRDYSKPQFIFNNTSLVNINESIPGIPDVLKVENLKPKIVDFFSLVRSYFFKKDSKNAETITSAILNNLIKVIKDNHSRIVFVYLPVFEEITDSGYSQTEEYFKSYCKNGINKYRDSVNCINTRPEFLSQSSKGTYFHGGQLPGHYDARANKLIAQVIREKLIDLKIL